MSDDTEEQQYDWPREIYAFAIDHSEFEVSGTYATSEHATVPRWEGDPERDRPVKEYIDRDILESQGKYFLQRIEALERENNVLKSALAPFAKMVKDNGYDGTDHRALTVTERTSNRTHKNAYLALQGRFSLIGATTAFGKE